MKYPGVQRWLVERLSLEPSLLSGAGFESLVEERLAASGVSESAYVAGLDRSEDEVDRLVEGIAVPETWFFRYPQSYRVLVEALRGRPAGAALRMLSIGCASGEEPYCMAMAALEAGAPAADIHITALDRNREALRRAANGEYGAFSIRTEIPDWAVQFLGRRGSTIVVDPAIRAMVRFAHADVLEPGALSEGAPYDVIFCRNVLIYLRAQARTRLLESMCQALAMGGLLFVGHAEALLCAALPLSNLSESHAFALRRVTKAAPEAIPQTPLAPSPLPRAPSRTFVPTVAARAPIRSVVTAEASVERPEPTLEEARALADSGRGAESEVMVRAIMSRSGPTAGGMELLGMLRLAQNDAAGARTHFEKAVYLDPERATSLLQLAVISESSGDARKAANYWDRARRASSTGKRERSE